MALVPPHYLNCVVAIGLPMEEEEPRWTASGFLYGDFVRALEGDQKEYHVFLVSNRHVFEEKREVLLRFNPQAGQPARIYHLDLIDESGTLRWHPHSEHDIDIGIVPMNVGLLREHEIQFSYFQSDHNVATLDKLAELEVSEGDFAYTLGFPMGLVGGERNYVIVRHGTIARIEDAISRTSSEFLLDTLIYPGNSGGPVVIKPEAMAITGTKPVQRAYLIGVVKSFVPYQDIAVSIQTDRPRVIFEENSGLAAVIPLDFVQEVVNEVP